MVASADAVVGEYLDDTALGDRSACAYPDYPGEFTFERLQPTDLCADGTQVAPCDRVGSFAGALLLIR